MHTSAAVCSLYRKAAAALALRHNCRRHSTAHTNGHMALAAAVQDWWCCLQLCSQLTTCQLGSSAPARPGHTCEGPRAYKSTSIHQRHVFCPTPCLLCCAGEENACDILVRSNCYCYALSRYVGSYCEPGLGSTGNPLPMPVRDCSAAVAGILSDGARSVDRNTVYTVPTLGSYIALAVKRPIDQRDTGDYHFWRLDADNTWSYKAGDTLSRNTYRNGTVLQDIELPEARGAYTQFCGYFEVGTMHGWFACCCSTCMQALSTQSH